MGNTRIYLIRHGPVHNPRNIFYGGSVDLTLSPEGRQQAKILGYMLKDQGVKPQAIITSTMLRAWEFGKILAVGLRVDSVIADERLCDNKIPQFAGLTQEEKEALFPSRDEYDPTLSGHETREAVLERMRNAYDEFVSELKGRTGLIVSHGDPLRFLHFSLLYPNKPLPPTEELSGLEQGQVWVIEINSKGRAFETGLIVPDERFFVRGEREIKNK